MEKKHRTFWGTLGVILVLFGGIYTIAFTLKGGRATYGLWVTGAAIFGGVLLMAWALGD